MEAIGTFIVSLILVLIAIGLGAIALWLLGILGGSKPVSSAEVTSDTSMNEGDFHSGPNGYSPNTAYPDTFYGSGGHDEGDFNR